MEKQTLYSDPKKKEKKKHWQVSQMGTIIFLRKMKQMSPLI